MDLLRLIKLRKLNNDFCDMTELEKIFINNFFTNLRVKHYNNSIFYISNDDNLWKFEYDIEKQKIYFSYNGVFVKFSQESDIYSMVEFSEFFLILLKNGLGLHDISIEYYHDAIEETLNKYIV